MSDTFTDSDGTVRLRGTFESGNTVRRLVTSAELLDLFTDPIELVPTPGVGRALIPGAINFVWYAGSTPYTGDFAVAVVTWNIADGATVASRDVSNLFGQADDRLVVFSAPAVGGTLPYFENLGLVYKVTGEALADGDGELVVDLAYTVLTL